jgi:hypothetical protein
MEHSASNLEKKESSAVWASSTGTSSEDPCGAIEQDPAEKGAGGTPLIGEERPPVVEKTLENLEGLTEKVGTLGFQITKKNRCGTARKWARRARLAEAGSGQPQSTPKDRPQAQQKPSISGALHRKGPAPTKLTSSEDGGPSQGPSKQQRSAGGTPEDGRAKRPKQIGQPSYARASREGHWVAIVGDDSPRSSISRENFLDIQRAIDRLVDEFPEEGLTPRLVDSYWTKGAAIMVCQDEATRDWLTSKVPTLEAWEGSRLKVVGLDALPTFKRVAAWFPGPVEDMERYFTRLHRLNRGLDTGQWRVYERREDPNGVRLVLSIDSAMVTILEVLKWRPFSGVVQAIFSLLGTKPEGRK